MKIIGEGHYPAEDYVPVFYPDDGKAATPLRVQVGQIRGALYANEETLVPKDIAQMLVDSGYNVEVRGDISPASEVDPELEQAVEAVEADAKATKATKATKSQQEEDA